MKKVLFGILFCSGFLFLEGCKGTDPVCTPQVPESKLTGIDQEQLTKDIEKIDAYLISKGITAQSEPNGTRYVITTLGTGDKIPCLENKLTIAYNGKIMGSGTVFDSSTNASFKLSGLILGWQLVLPLIPGGSKVTLYIPSGYAYGNSVAANGKIPANANLVFEIELL
ncbi:MAG: FKBP-type peptidyl-prolyl cis-trans isomerase [Cyclobacteriaceae bacterium]|nr:FKBP-type peptidyl-prolyl cis-trans isomerase [Cyclobacteriaceae bacterium]